MLIVGRFCASHGRAFMTVSLAFAMRQGVIGDCAGGTGRPSSAARVGGWKVMEGRWSQPVEQTRASAWRVVPEERWTM